MYYKIVDGDYILAIGTGPCPGDGIKIGLVEFNSLLAAMQSRPTPEDGYDYRLTVDLEWEQFEVSTVDEENDVPTEEDYINAMRLLGVEV